MTGLYTLETVSGRFVDILNPDPATIDIDDIAWSLSRIPRFAGATIPLVPYSVAQHSIEVSRELDLNHYADYDHSLMAIYGLLHDSAEYGIGDIPSPAKHIPGVYEGIKKVEDSLMEAIYKSLRLPLPTKEQEVYIKEADMIQRAIEAHAFMSSRGKNWNLPKVSLKKLQSFQEPMSSIDAYEAFLTEFNRLYVIVTGEQK